MTTHRSSRHEKPELGDFKKAGGNPVSRPKSAAEREARLSADKAEKSRFRTQLSL